MLHSDICQHRRACPDVLCSKPAVVHALGFGEALVLVDESSHQALMLNAGLPESVSRVLQFWVVEKPASALCLLQQCRQNMNR